LREACGDVYFSFKVIYSRRHDVIIDVDSKELGNLWVNRNNKLEIAMILEDIRELSSHNPLN
jgi:hypothetical protein